MAGRGYGLGGELLGEEGQHAERERAKRVVDPVEPDLLVPGPRYTSILNLQQLIKLNLI